MHMFNFLAQIAILFEIIQALQYQPKVLVQSSAVDQNQLSDIWDISLRRNHEFENAETISFGFWLKWSYIAPKIIEKQNEWYSICRLTARENHTDYQNPLDRALSIWLSKDFYHFTTYTIEYPEKFFNIKYEQEQLDGKWTFIFYGYSYQENLARGYILFDNNQLEEALIPAKHYRLDYLRFLIKREFDNFQFNGFYSNIFLSINEDYPSSKELIYSIMSDHNFISSLNFHQIFSQNILINTKIDSYYDKDALQQFEFPEIDPTEYSLSGWLKFKVPVEQKDQNLIARLSHGKQQNLIIFDKIFYLIEKDIGYYFETYDCTISCQNVNWTIETYNQESEWHFIYMAYNLEMGKIFQFYKFEEKAFTLEHSKIKHYQPHGLYLNIQKDQYTAGYNGYLKRWTFNYGKGAYVEENFEKDQLLQSKIGIIDFIISQPSQIWKFKQTELYISFDSKVDLQENEIDPAEESFDTNEYGYGFWMRFLYNQGSRTAQSANQTLGVSRFGTAQMYKRKQNLGESTLSIYLKDDQLTFETYSIIFKDVKQFDVKHQLDNNWLYIYTGYKRVYEEQGQYLGCIYDIRGQNQCIKQQNDIIHYDIDNFVFFSIGSIGQRLSDIKHFSGNILDARLYYGKDSIIPKFYKQTLQEVLPQQIWITKQQEQFSVDRSEKIPSEYCFQDYTSEYGVELWFKSNGKTESEYQVIYLLSQSNLTIENENTLLEAKLDNKNNIVLSSHSYDSNYYIQQIQNTIEIEHDQDKMQWTYLYFGYKQSKCLYFVQTKTSRMKNQLNCKHHGNKQFFLYKGYDGHENNFLGDLDYFKINFGQGAFQSQFYQKTEAFQFGLVLFPTSFEWKSYFQKIISLQSTNSGLQEVFSSNNKISMNGQRNYGYGFWSRYLTEFPDEASNINNSSFISISSFFIPQSQNKELEILSLFISSDKQQYKIKTYDLNTSKYKFGTFSLLSSQEGVWNYIYLSYSADEKQVVGFIYSFKSKRVIRVIIPQVYHNSLNGKVNFNLGQFANYDGFNGQVQRLVVHFDGTSYKKDIEEFKEMVKSTELLSIPEELKEYQFIAISQQSEYKQYQVHFEENYFPEDYSIFGWFRPDFINSDERDEAFSQTLLMLSSQKNKEQEAKRHQFKALLTQNGVEISTYSIHPESQPSTWEQNIQLDSNFGAWFYIDMSYSSKLQQVAVYFKIIDDIQVKLFYDIEHYLVNQLLLQFSDLNMDSAFKGEVCQLGMQVGEGSYKTKDNLPEIQLNQQHQLFEYKNYLGDFSSLNRLNIIQGKHELIGATQYSILLWARWLHEISLDSVLDSNMLFRLARDLNYENCQEEGDRTLMVTITQQAYQFSTYNSITDECSQDKGVFHHNLLEGQWNLIYFGYQNSEIFVGAKGMILFSKNQVSNTVEFNVEHHPLSSIAALSIGQREFSFGKFYGQMHDIQVTIGYGFENDIESLKKRTITPDPDLNVFMKHNLLQEEILMDNLENSKFQSQLKLEKQYALFGWFKNKGLAEFGNYSIVARVSTSQELNGELADQTFLVLVNDHTILFKSYTLESYEMEIGETNEIMKAIDFVDTEVQEWIFFYMGYNFEENKLLVYVKYNNDLHQQQQMFTNVYHYLPLEFNIFVGQDSVYSKFNGWLDDINLLTGQSSFIEEHIYEQLGSLNRKYISDVLQ